MTETDAQALQALRALADRIEIDALRSEYTDAGTMRDLGRLAGLFTEDAVWRIPSAGIELSTRDGIRSNLERMQQVWEFFVQNTHPGAVQVDGDTATGRVFVEEIGRMRDGSSHRNRAIFHDTYRRTADGWKFSERVYEIVYIDTSALTGTASPRNITV